jgi:hypothetical protein
MSIPDMHKNPLGQAVFDEFRLRAVGHAIIPRRDGQALDELSSLAVELVEFVPRPAVYAGTLDESERAIGTKSQVPLIGPHV